MRGGLGPFSIQSSKPVPHLVAQELLGQSPERVLHQEAPRQVDQLEFLYSGVDLQLGGGEGRHAGLRGHGHVHACGQREGGLRAAAQACRRYPPAQAVSQKDGTVLGEI